MVEIKYSRGNLKYIFVFGPESELSILDSLFNLIPGYMFLPSWTGPMYPEVFLNRYRNKDGVRWCWSGLWKTIESVCDKLGIQCSGNIDSGFKYLKATAGLTHDALKKEIDSWGLSVIPRDYQIKAAYFILKYRQALFQIATRAGKTLIAYIVFRYLLSRGIIKKALLVVPSIQLVKQGIADFNDYGEYFNIEEIWGKGSPNHSANLTIGTFQSLVKKTDPRDKKYDQEWMERFGCVCIDEAHHLTCKSVKDILTAACNRLHSWGFTGTLPDEGTIESYYCHALMGPTVSKISTDELVKDGYIVPPEITQVYIKHEYNDVKDILKEYGEKLCKNSNAVREARKQLDEPDYVRFLIRMCSQVSSNGLRLEQYSAISTDKHQNVIDNIIAREPGNTIVFAHTTEYLKKMAEHFKSRFPDKNVYLIHGAVSADKRAAIVNRMDESDNCVLAASFGCVSTGLTFKNVSAGIFAQPFKSKIVSLQSIGRGLLKKDGKKSFKLYDIVDVMPLTQKLVKHAKERLKTYKDENFKVSKTEIQ